MFHSFHTIRAYPDALIKFYGEIIISAELYTMYVRVYIRLDGPYSPAAPYLVTITPVLAGQGDVIVPQTPCRTVGFGPRSFPVVLWSISMEQ